MQRSDQKVKVKEVNSFVSLDQLALPPFVLSLVPSYLIPSANASPRFLGNGFGDILTPISPEVIT